MATSACEPPSTEPEVDLTDMRREDDPLPLHKGAKIKVAVIATHSVSLEQQLEGDLVDLKQFEEGSYDHSIVLSDPAC